MIKVKVQEDPNTVEAIYDGKTHRAIWDDEEGLQEVEGDEDMLRALMTAWDGREEFEISPSDLELQGGGHWSPKS